MDLSHSGMTRSSVFTSYSSQIPLTTFLNSSAEEKTRSSTAGSNASEMSENNHLLLMRYLILGRTSVTSTMNVNYLYPRYKAIPQELNFAVKSEYLDLLFRLQGLDDAKTPRTESEEATSGSQPTPEDLPSFLKVIQSNVVLIRALKNTNDSD